MWILNEFLFDYLQVFVGRPMLWGLSYSGEQGAKQVLEMFRKEIDLTFALTGKSISSNIIFGFKCTL